MRIRLSVLIFLILSVILAACSSGGGEEVLPTIMELPTLDEQESTDVPTSVPTEEPPTETLVPSATPEPTEAEEPTPTAEEVNDPQQASNNVPSFILNSASGTNNSGLPPFLQGGAAAQQFTSATSWEVTGEEPVNVYECADTDCEIVATLQPGDEVEVIAQGNEWYSILIDDTSTSAFVPAEFIVPVRQGPGALPPGVSTDGSGPSVSVPPFGNGGGFPPGVNPDSFNTPAPPAPPGAGD